MRSRCCAVPIRGHVWSGADRAVFAALVRWLPRTLRFIAWSPWALSCAGIALRGALADLAVMTRSDVPDRRGGRQAAWDSVTNARLDGAYGRQRGEDTRLDGRVWEAMHVGHC